MSMAFNTADSLLLGEESFCLAIGGEKLTFGAAEVQPVISLWPI